jgi:hypothetical protein
MQTLGLSNSTPRSESRLKSLFWPSVHSAVDVDYLGVQGYWICTLIACVSFVALLAAGQPAAAFITLLLYYLGGVGVREGSHFAAGIVLALYLLDTLASGLGGLGIMRVILMAVLLSNLRATWIASRWTPGSEESVAPPRLSENWLDKLCDRVPSWLWPKVRILYYIFSLFVLLLAGIGIGGNIFQK